MKKDRVKRFLIERGKTAIPGLLTAFATCFMLFIYAPLELYVTNQTEFWFDFYKILKAVLENFAVFFAVNAFVMLLAAGISKALCRIFTGMELAALLTLYVQGNFLVNHMPPFDGTEIIWEDYRGENIKTAIVCILITAVIAVAAKLLGTKRFQGICMAVSAGLGGILLFTLVTIILTTGAYRERTTYYALENGQYQLSQDQNFLILLLDAVDAKAFEEVMDSAPVYEETFADFTYYPDMVGAYPWTAYSVPYILSGKWYDGDQYYLDYAAAAVDESGLFRELSERDYDIALYESDPWVTSYTYQFSNMVELQHEVYVWKYFRRAICKLGGIRYAPFFLKEYCYRAISQTQGQHNAFVDESNPLYTWDLKEFAAHMQEEEVTYQDGKCFRYYHLQGGHVPFLYDADLNAVGNADYSETLEANIRVIDRFLQKLKRSGVYDNSIIIVMADHGFDPQDEVSAYDRQNPLFLVKGVGESHPLQTSLVPAAYEDLPYAYVKLMNGAAGGDIFPYKEGEKRERRYIFYENTNHIMYEWMQTGPAWDFGAYRATGVSYQRKN